MSVGVSLREAQVLRDVAFDSLRKAMASKAIDAEGLRTMRNDINQLREQFIYWDEFVQYLGGRGTSMEFRNLIGGEV